MARKFLLVLSTAALQTPAQDRQRAGCNCTARGASPIALR
jgi:hypothetical protein